MKKPGTRSAYPYKTKIQTRRSLPSLLARLRRQRKRIVFTNGCFDLLHIGHLRYLQRARRCGDLLIVGINSDRSVRNIKEPGRPLLPQAERAEVIAALACVDYVTLFNEPDPYNLIQEIRPAVLIKGSDWGRNEIIGRDLVERYGGKVRRIPLVRGLSTTRIIDKVLRLP